MAPTLRADGLSISADGHEKVSQFSKADLEKALCLANERKFLCEYIEFNSTSDDDSSTKSTFAPVGSCSLRSSIKDNSAEEERFSSIFS